MSATLFHLAQINIGRILAPLDNPIMMEFVDSLDRVNALADASPGFVWRLKTEDGDATGTRPYQDELILVNLSVWETSSALQDYVYRNQHKEIMRKRRQWFAPFDGAYYALWWIKAGHLPTVEEAKERLDYLRGRGVF